MNGTSGRGRPAALPALWASLAATAVLSGVFVAFPDLDLWLSELAYDPSVGHFVGSGNAWVSAVRDLGRLATYVALGGCAAVLGLGLARPARRDAATTAGAAAALLGFLLGPLALVNWGLKEHWGRARPSQILEFGGELSFQPAWAVSDQCARNCSFVSGEGAAIFWLLLPLALLPGAFRRPAVAAGVVLAFAVAGARYLRGAHFTSDVLLAGALACLVNALCLWVVRDRDLLGLARARRG